MCHYMPGFANRVTSRGVRHQLESCTIRLESRILHFKKTGYLWISTHTVEPVYG